MSKSTEIFKTTIQSHLAKIAEKDPLFAEALQKENKNIDDCCTYILNQVQQSGCNGFADSEIFGMAVHYYDEDDVEPGSQVSIKHVVVNHSVELSQQDIEEAKKLAFERVVSQEEQRIKNKPIKTKKSQQEQPTLF